MTRVIYIDAPQQIIHYWHKGSLYDLIHCEEIFLDLSQNISYDWFTVSALPHHKLLPLPVLSKSSVTKRQIGLNSTEEVQLCKVVTVSRE